MIDVRKLVGIKIKELRLKTGLSQEKFAEKINIDTSNISKLENGKVYFTYKVLESLCETFNVQPKYFYNSPELYQTQDDIEKIEVINELLKDLNSEKLTYILEMSKILAK